MLPSLLLLLLCVCRASALDNGLGQRPPMGFNPWNCFGVNRRNECHLPLPWLPDSGPKCHGFNESVMLQIAKSIAFSPLKDAGYIYVNLDCGYSTKRRDADGTLVVNNTRYPHGMAWLGEQIHALGLKFGMYSAASHSQCCSKVDPHADDGSAGHEVADSALFASWGVDYLKHDDCDPTAASYEAMRDALNATGRQIFYSIHPPQELIARRDIANMWRTTTDIQSNYESIMEKALLNNEFAKYARPGSWNDPDMLEVGNLFTPFGDAEGRTQFSLWCLMKAPLLLGTDVTNMTAATLATVANAEAIAINQDSLGVQGELRYSSNLTQVWSGPLEGGAVAVALHNVGNDTTRTITLMRSALPVEARGMEGQLWRVRHIWHNKTLLGQQLPVSVEVAPRDVALLVLRPEQATPRPQVHASARVDVVSDEGASWYNTAQDFVV